MLSLQTETVGDTRTLRLRGELDLASADVLETELGDALGDGGSRVVVDLRELIFIDSTGIAILVAAIRRDEGDGKLRFVPSRAQAVTRVLRLTGVEERMPLLDGDSSNSENGASEPD
jgi:anti-sigma B factor antagonist